MARVLNGPTRRVDHSCLLCGRGLAGKAHLHPQRPIHHRIVECIGGRRPKGWRKWPPEQKAKLKGILQSAGIV